MTELNLGGSSMSPAPPTDKPARKPSRALRVTVAALLSLLLPGTGQLYVRKIWRGIALALVVVAIDALVVELRLFILCGIGLHYRYDCIVAAQHCL